VSRSAEPHYRNRVDASVSGGERETPAADEQRERAVTGGDPACAYATRGRAPTLRRPSLIDGRLIPVSTRAGTCYRVPTYISSPPTRNPVCADRRAPGSSVAPNIGVEREFGELRDQPAARGWTCFGGATGSSGSTRNEPRPAERCLMRRPPSKGAHSQRGVRCARRRCRRVRRPRHDVMARASLAG